MSAFFRGAAREMRPFPGGFAEAFQAGIAIVLPGIRFAGGLHMQPHAIIITIFRVEGRE